jgi:hypothetical protein
VITDDIAAATAEHLGIMVDPRVSAAAEAAVEWAEKRRCLTPPSLLWISRQVRQGATLYAAHLYQLRAAPSGTDLYGDPGLTVSVLPRASELVGLDPVIA